MAKTYTLKQWAEGGAFKKEMEVANKEIKESIVTGVFNSVSDFMKQSEEYAQSLTPESIQKFLAEEKAKHWEAERINENEVAIGNTHRTAKMFEFGSRAKGLPVEPTSQLERESDLDNPDSILSKNINKELDKL